ncbi:MAG: PASTA domain-containing protein [Lachnospiraceae bacterium]|nr:PASTA domain-containing protein [Lachnospiraceae bacterium]
MEEKKEDKKFFIGLGILMVAVVIVAWLYSRSVVHPQVTINGKELHTGMTVGELVEEGLSISYSSSGKKALNIATEAKVPGEKYTTTPYYIMSKGEATDVCFRVYNSDVNACSFRESKIYSFNYHAGANSGKSKVLINGIDFRGMSKEEAVEAFEELGVKFDKDDKEEFLNGEKGIVIGKSGDFHFTLETDYEKKVIEFVEVKLRV